LAEYGYRTRGGVYGLHPNPVWLFLEAAAALASLLYAWRAQSRLRLPLLLALALAFHLGWLLLHWHLSVPGDGDPKLYELQGNSLLDGHYPRSEYPPGAVLLFAAEGLLSGSDPGAVHTFLMVPLQLTTVWAIWSLRTRYSAWFAALVALWPMNTFFWEFRFDLAPTALLATGLLLSYRERWGWSGLVLGLGTVVKWTPALSFAALAAWCVVGGRRRPAARLAGGFLAGVLVIYLPLLAWSPTELWAAYSQQGARSVTGESLWYLPLRLFGVVGPVPDFAAVSAGAPQWADVLAAVVQALLVVGVITVAAAARHRSAAVAAAAVAPALFLATNRIFSPQFLVVMLAAWAIAAALLAQSEREQLLYGLAMMAATLANVFVYPHVLWNRDATWEVCSAILFLTALTICGWSLVRVLRPQARAATSETPARFSSPR
jgi:Glycosyltransferase family 87